MDFSKGCIRFHEDTCDCDVNIGECKAKDFQLENWKNDYLRLSAKVTELERYLEWNISSIKHSISTRESVITLKVYEELLLKLNAGGGI